LKAYQAGLAEFEKANTKILGISVNKSETNASFAKKIGVTFSLLCDTDKTVSKSFGVLSFFRVARRATFLVDKAGVIRHVDEGEAATSPKGALAAAQKLAD
jgi:peroxiredoxin